MVSVPVRLRNVLPPAVRGGDAGAAAKVNVPLPSVGVVADAGWASSAAATTIARSAAVQVRTRSPKREFLPTIDVSSPQMLSDEHRTLRLNILVSITAEPHPNRDQRPIDDHVRAPGAQRGRAAAHTERVTAWLVEDGGGWPSLVRWAGHADNSPRSVPGETACAVA